MDIPDLILSNLKACPTRNDKWRYAFELIVGAAASLLSTHPHYVGTSHYDNKQRYDSQPEILHDLLHEAHKEAARTGQPINLYYDGLEDWTAGYFFNSGIVRIACAYEYTLCTACSKDPYEGAHFKRDSDILKQKSPTLELRKQLDVIGRLKNFGTLEKREQQNNEVNDLIDRLVREKPPTEQEQVGSIYERLGSKDGDFIEAALFFVWCDYNWFKHRPMGYPTPSHVRKDPRVQLALALRAYSGLCEFYSWCHNLSQTEVTRRN
jgi:hypothetical protein